MIKVLIVANHAKEHINKFHLTTIRRLRELGWQVDVACRLDEAVPDCDRQYDLPCDRNPFGIGTIKGAVRLRKILKAGEYDIVHCHTSTGKIMTILALLGSRRDGLKVFCTLHGCYFYQGAPLKNWMIGLPTEWLMSFFFDVYITINEEDYHNALKYRFRSGAIMKMNGAGVVLERFRRVAARSELAKRELRSKLRLDPDAFYLVYVAELNANKNQESLVKMMAGLRSQLPQAKLLLVGQDHYGGQIQKYVIAEGLQECVQCLGWRNDIPELLCCADVYVASSIREGLGINLLEAMACGLPVVAYENRGHREIIRDGVNGFLVRQGDHAAMALQVLEIYRNPESITQITENGKSTAMQFSDHNVFRQLEAIYLKAGITFPIYDAVGMQIYGEEGS